jgi:hypothetical protein
VWERRQLYTKFWSEYLKGRDNSGNLGMDGRIILVWTLGEWGGGNVWTEFIWLRIGTSGGLL